MRCKDLPAACQDRVLRKVPLADSLRIIGRGSSNWLAHRPIVVSFEVTDACSCRCKHCDHGGRRDESRNLKPADYRRYMQALRRCVVQVSGGESLLRDDVADIVRAIQDGDTLPYTILVSNWSHMTEGLYFALAWIFPTPATTRSASIPASIAIWRICPAPGETRAR